jgi:peptidyl-prolyl cis-trans isomerase C
MIRKAFIAIAALALPVAAQQQPAAQQPVAATATAPAVSTTTPIVANINGEIITKAKLDALYDRMNVQMRNQYEKAGGKGAFLDNYLRKRLLVQEAIKAGFDKRPEVQAEVEAARESAIFDRYIRDVVASNVVTEADIKKFYDENGSEFGAPERVKVRHIIIMANGAGPKPKTKQEAADLIAKIALDLRQKIATAQAKDPESAKRILQSYFSEAAVKYSEDGVAQIGGDLGWVTRGSLDSKFEDAAYALQPGTMSNVVETRFGYHLIYVEDKQASGKEPYASVRGTIREYLLSQKMPDIMETVTRLTNELKASSKVAIYPENVK